ncbi:hypothetical protein QYE76_052477 [Lolium multiflorum]|uniref:Uncharacterized protein n=1 Tax=Lolium multiflorum TaxID=4521 RepID=A0AAD8STT6_LOLMU|nr:hypothetical protein QYE76_052477 [Lolium multiflorum]
MGKATGASKRVRLRRDETEQIFDLLLAEKHIKSLTPLEKDGDEDNCSQSKDTEGPLHAIGSVKMASATRRGK